MDKKLLKEWTINCALGELLGIAAAGSIAFGVIMFFGEAQDLKTKIITLVAMLVAGFIEGSLLAHFQWKVLRKKFTSLPKKEWMFYTVLIAMLGWFLGMLPSLFFMPENSAQSSSSETAAFDNPVIFALLSIAMGLVLGALFGLFQWFSLRKYAQHAWHWILANALGWGAGLGWIYLFASLPNAQSSILVIALVGLMGGALAGTSVGLITGLFLIKMSNKLNWESKA